MSGLLGIPLGGVKGQAHDKNLRPPLTGQGGNGVDIDVEILTMQRGQGGHRDAEGIATRQADAAVAHIQGQGRAGLGGSHLDHSALSHGSGEGAAPWLERFKHGFQPSGGFLGGGGGLAAPKTSAHQDLLTVAGGPQLLQPEVAHPIGELHPQPERLAGPTQTMQQQGRWRAQQRFATRHHREFNELPPLRLIRQPADPSHRLTANGIHKHPAPGAALIDQILTATIEDLAQLGRAGGLFEVPKLGGGMAVEGQQFEALGQGGGRPIRLPAPEGIPSQGLETLLSQGRQTGRIQA